MRSDTARPPFTRPQTGRKRRFPAFGERLWLRAEELAATRGRAFVLLDEVRLLQDWAAHLKGEWDRLRRRKLLVHVIATGSYALELMHGSRESLAGRFERLTLTHWSASSLAEAFRVPPNDACEALVKTGSYPGAFELRGDAARWSAYARDAILEPAIGRDILSLAAVRRPGLLR